ncbi:MAG: ComEC/Rec2 family competence protein [Chlamydiales bacterium]|nr:ComEC/Rec2 family competence protein [Chlamydiales bacterium]
MIYFSEFWRAAPALFVGCNLLLSAAAVYYPHPAYIFACAVLWVPLALQREWKKLLSTLLLCSLFFAHLSYLYHPPQSETDKPQIGAASISGTGYFEIESVREVQSPFNRSYLYQGSLRSFETQEGEKLKNIPCNIHLPYKKERPLASCDYLVEGSLFQKRAHTFVLKPAKSSIWQPVPNSFSFAEWRYQIKERARSFLHEQIPNPRAASFFIALTIGDLDDRLLSLEFAKVGLQHILGVSGFHFVLLAAFLGFLLRLFLPFKATALLLLILLSFYFFFVGSAPAVVRGWVAICVFLVARLFHLNTSALNALGVGLSVEILWNPISVTTIGFQLSFLCTWAILILYPLFRRGINLILPKRTLQTAVEMSPLHQHGYIFSSLIREALSLNLAVHFASLPLLLFLFHKFPLQSLIYNLFFPFCFSASLLLLLISIIFSFLIPPLGTLLHSCNSAFTGGLLDMIGNASPLLDLSIRTHTLPFWLLILLLSLLFALPFFLKKDR